MALQNACFYLVYLKKAPIRCLEKDLVLVCKLDLPKYYGFISCRYLPTIFCSHICKMTPNWMSEWVD